ncbi:hypothetical protein HDU78_008577 [Chytriomyces hyalinus]|nr:hypothetical protein HDU78_008577 [Chytriomyces hyalinus]
MLRQLPFRHIQLARKAPPTAPTTTTAAAIPSNNQWAHTLHGRSITNTSKGIIPATASARQGVAKVEAAVKEAEAAVKKAQSHSRPLNSALKDARAALDKREVALKDARHYHLALSGADPKKASLSGSLQSIASMEVDVRWKDEVPPEYSLSEGSLYFVNRTDAVKQLQNIHRLKFRRAVFKAGTDWVIPIADNVVGLGKSDFGWHYIRKSREMWPNTATRGRFEQTLCDCHTVHIQFDEGALLQNSFDAVMIESLCNALEGMFVVPPAIISDPPKTARKFLKDLTKVAGPVFIVLDEIGNAFTRPEDPLDDFQKRDQFLSFCQSILGMWLPMENVFFVVLGRASFLNYVGLRPTNANLTHSPYVFERLNIHLLQPPSIRTIMDNTLISSAGTDTITTRLGLTQQNSKAVAEHLFRQTNGHPRTLIYAFKSCHSVDDILQYHQPQMMLNWKEFYERLVINKPTVMSLLKKIESGTAVDLTKTTIDAGIKD